MTWSYLYGSDARPLDQVRLSIGDTLQADPQFQDEEIDAFIANRGSLLGACADACRALSARFSRSVTQKGGGSAANFSDLAKAYLTQALQFEAQAALAGSAMPYAGGISISDKLAQEADADRVPPNFTIGMDDAMLPVPPVGLETETQGDIGCT